MAERRMFAKTIVLSDAFLDMPLSARCLYFTLGMLADDDGFVNSPKSIMRQCGASADDMNVLLAKKFVLAFDSGVIVIKHWRINNYLRNDRYQETKYSEEKEQLRITENGSYTLGIPKVVYPGKDRLGKDRLDKDINTSCAEGNNPSPQKADVEAIPLADNSEWLPTADEYEEYRRLYPGVDVRDEFRKIRAWCISNPTNRKTPRGVKRFVNGWLSRAQDKPRKKQPQGIKGVSNGEGEFPF